MIPPLFPWLFWMGAGFLAGGIMFSQLTARLLAGRNLTQESGDHNPGAVNAFLLCGPAVGTACLLLDLFKGFVPVFMAKGSADMRSLLFAGVIAAPVLGHAVGLFNHFRGGKCIATAFGVLAALAPQCWIVLLLAGLYILFSTVVKVSPMTRRSILVFTLFGVLAFGLLAWSRQFSLALGCGMVAAVAVYRHWRALPKGSPEEGAKSSLTLIKF